MSGISNISKIIRKPYCRVKLNRAISRIFSANIKEMNQLIKINETQRKIFGNVHIVAESPTLNVPNRTNDLRMWVLNHNITRRSVNDLLRILRGIGLNWLSMDSRTLCKTPRSTNVIAMAGGQYWYNGIGTNIRLLFEDIKCSLTLELNINVDGVPLMNSSSTQFWPILANIHSKLKINFISI